MGQMKDNPLFSNMMGGLDPTNMGQNNEGSDNSDLNSEKELTREEKKQRLREKINAKKKNRN